MTRLWQRLRFWARLVLRDGLALYIAARHPRTPWFAKLLALLVAAYALSPIDLIPDAIPVLGLVDEVILLPIAIALIARLIPAEVMEGSRAARRVLPLSSGCGFWPPGRCCGGCWSDPMIAAGFKG